MASIFFEHFPAECNLIPLAVRSPFMCEASYCPLFDCEPDHIAPVFAQLVWSGAVPALRLMVVSLPLDVAPSIAALAGAVGARIRVWFDFLSYSCSNLTFVH